MHLQDSYLQLLVHLNSYFHLIRHFRILPGAFPAGGPCPGHHLGVLQPPRRSAGAESQDVPRAGVSSRVGQLWGPGGASNLAGNFW